MTETVPEAQAALYRLNGDLNPLHIDPAAAKRAGFDRPILHGLCTYGYATRAIINGCLEGDQDRLKGFDARFSSPVYPGRHPDHRGVEKRGRVYCKGEHGQWTGDYQCVCNGRIGG